MRLRDLAQGGANLIDGDVGVRHLFCGAAQTMRDLASCSRGSGVDEPVPHRSDTHTKIDPNELAYRSPIKDRDRGMRGALPRQQVWAARDSNPEPADKKFDSARSARFGA